MKKITSKDINGNEVTVTVRMPTKDVYDRSTIAYSRALRNALDNGAMLRDKLISYYREQNVWNEQKQKKQEEILEKITVNTRQLEKGGIPLKKARDIAIETRRLRADLRELIAERQSYDKDAAESIADNERFNFLMSECIYDADNNKKIWPSLEAYNQDSEHPWALEAASHLANQLYGLQEDYEKNLTENKFLVKYNFANEDLWLKNEDGHLIDEKGRLINEEGRFVAYDENNEQYFVDSNGNRLDEEEFYPFLDDDGNPVVDEEQIEEKPKRTRKKKEEQTT